jgi:hypothetical protein
MRPHDALITDADSRDRTPIAPLATGPARMVLSVIVHAVRLGRPHLGRRVMTRTTPGFVLDFVRYLAFLVARDVAFS